MPYQPSSSPKTVDPAAAHTLNLLLGEIESKGVQASGIIHANGTIQITMKPKEVPSAIHDLRIHDILLGFLDSFADQDPNAFV